MDSEWMIIRRGVDLRARLRAVDLAPQTLAPIVGLSAIQIGRILDGTRVRRGMAVALVRALNERLEVDAFFEDATPNPAEWVARTPRMTVTPRRSPDVDPTGRDGILAGRGTHS
jgi:hypothetical protein